MTNSLSGINFRSYNTDLTQKDESLNFPQLKPSKMSLIAGFLIASGNALNVSQNATSLTTSLQLSFANSTFISETLPQDSTELVNDICLIANTSHICNGNFGIARIDMPQIVGEVLDNYLEDLSKRNVSVMYKEISARSLTPVQKEMNFKKVQTFVTTSSQRNPCDEHILVASDKYVIDGHHRFAACHILDQNIKIISISATITVILEELKSFPGVTKAAL